MKTAPVKFAPLATALVLCLALPACNSEPEETPDLEDVMPLDNPEDAASDDTGEEAQGDTSGTSDGSDADTADDSAAAMPDLPDTMESGSNADGGRAVDPTRSKLLPAD